MTKETWGTVRQELLKSVCEKSKIQKVGRQNKIIKPTSRIKVYDFHEKAYFTMIISNKGDT